MGAKGPQEVSSRVRPPAARRVVHYARPRAADPRFDRACGRFAAGAFRAAYGFVAEMQSDERHMAAAAASRAGDSVHGERIKKLAQRLNDMHAAKKIDDARREVRSAHVRREAAAVTAGKKDAFYLRGAELRRMAEARLLEQRLGGKSGAAAERLAEAIRAKRERRRASREKRRLPAFGVSAGGDEE